MELPEAEIVCRQLRENLLGKSFGRARILNKSFVASPRGYRWEGRRVDQVQRHGKLVAAILEDGAPDGGCVAAFRFGMTGQARIHRVGDPIESHTHVILPFGDSGLEVRIRDIRRFGRVIVRDPAAFDEWLRMEMAPDPLEMTSEEFASRVGERSAPIKHVLLNQRVVSGIGNIYSDEALHICGIHPHRRAHRVPREELAALRGVLVALLDRAIAHGGSTISDYVDVYGRPGTFQEHHRVYGRYGRPCLKCGTILKRILEPSRSFTFCPSCQPRRNMGGYLHSGSRDPSY